MLAPELTGEQAPGSAQRKGKWADHPPQVSLLQQDVDTFP